MWTEGLLELLSGSGGEYTNAGYGQVMPTKSLNTAEEGTQGTTFERKLLDCVACGILVIDADGNIVTMSGDAANVLRLPPIALTSGNWSAHRPMRS